MADENNSNARAEIMPALPADIIASLSEAAAYGLAQTSIADNFLRAYGVAAAVDRMTKLLTPQAMEPIMALQNSPLGFLTDKQAGGYPVDTVRSALIQAAIEGLGVYGNQWNIIAGRMYVTKNGMREKLRRIQGLRYSIVVDVPHTSGDRGAVVTAHVIWSLNGGETRTQDLPLAVRINSGMGADAIMGKATRKARAWLYEELTGNAVDEGEVGDSAPIDITPRAASEPAPAEGNEAQGAGPLPLLQKM